MKHLFTLLFLFTFSISYSMQNKKDDYNDFEHILDESIQSYKNYTFGEKKKKYDSIKEQEKYKEMEFLQEAFSLHAVIYNPHYKHSIKQIKYLINPVIELIKNFTKTSEFDTEKKIEKIKNLKNKIEKSLQNMQKTECCLKHKPSKIKLKK